MNSVSPRRLFIAIIRCAAWAGMHLPLHAQSVAASDWWAVRPIERLQVPAVSNAALPRTAIDRFIQGKLEQHGLSIAPEADRRTLLRRLKFDLHGLPPTPEELDEFERDQSPDAYDRLVDRLLDSPRYGERWARHWLDVVRFSESMGYERDRIREHAWRYRDWVIEAFNDDRSYGDFVRAQIAGDALDPEDAEAAVATGFLVTGPNNDVGNQSQLELMRERADELDEIVQNVTSVFLGVTVGCARCHDHKFDPVPTRDYYRIAAVFSGVKFGNRPLVPTRDGADLSARIAVWDGRIRDINQRLSTIRQDLDALAAFELNPRRNEERFDPIEARFVRMTILGTVDGEQPCIDEIEIYGAAGPTAAGENLAAAAQGAKATASSLLPGYPIHRVEHLNDGKTGNSHSWISNEPGAGWCQIELARPAAIARIVWGRDRESKFADRLPAEYVLEYSLDGQTFSRITPDGSAAGDSDRARRIRELRGDRQRLQDDKRAIDQERATIDRLPKSWSALSTPAVPLKVLKRGDVLTPGEDAPAGTLSCIDDSGWGGRAGANTPSSAEFGALDIAPDDPEPVRRLKFADWVVHPNNPLTWRVIANRVWHYHFGAGLVRTPSDFGAGGAAPTHPELLDWLADEFRSSGGRFKAMHRMIVRSAVYRQGAPVAAAPNDADNTLLWRPHRRRLDAESLRDAILFVSGTLDRSVGGPSYRPFQYIDGNIPVYEPLPERPETWRRTIYRHVVRTHRQPFLDTFDCPDPSVMTPARTATTTPLQALSLLNNEFVVDQAGRFADRVKREIGGDPAAQSRRAFRMALLKDPSEGELHRAGEFVRRYGLDQLCRVLLNTNEFLYVD